MGEKGKNRGEIRKISHWYMYFSVSDYVNLHFTVTNNKVVKCNMYYNKCKHSLAVVHLTINIFVYDYQNLLVIFTAALSPTISSTHY